MSSASLSRVAWARHVVVGGVASLLVYGFWLSRPQWVAEMRLWRAIGDASLILLYVTLVMGPLARFVPQSAGWLRYRRETGAWFGFLAMAHTVLILNGWARWDLKTFLGYAFIPELGRFVRLESGFGLANLVGLTAMLITLPLVATSADWAVRALGGGAWKVLHYLSYSIFWLVVLHTVYFLFIHFTQHFHRRPPPDPNWFRWPFVALTLAVVILQASAFIKTVQQQKRQTVARSAALARGAARDNRA